MKEIVVPNHRLVIAGLIVTAALTGMACDYDTYLRLPVGNPEPATVHGMQAFYCATRNTSQCSVRGDSIPVGTLPPTTESFMVWARTPGSNNTQACLYTSFGNGCTPTQEVQDSTGFSTNVTGTAHNYRFVISILGQTNNVISSDSLIWLYP